MTIQFVRTPDSAFVDLPGFPYSSRHLDDLPGHEGMRLTYLDEGPQDAPVVLCLHGEPSWGYLYRKMIPVFTDAGYRVVVPDWYGFGRSDKPTRLEDYTWDFHHGTMVALVERLHLEAVTLVVQDWGGMLGLTLPVTHPSAVSRLLIMNTGFNVGTALSDGFRAWREYVRNTPDLSVTDLFRRSHPSMTDAEAAAYGAPFPGPEHKAGVRAFPLLVATNDSDPGVDISREAVHWWSQQFDGQSFMAVGVDDPVLGRPVMDRVHSLIRGCPPPLYLDVGHFVQERGDEVARAALAAWGE